MGQIYCTQCGTANDESNNYCINCQAQLGNTQTEVIAQPVHTSSSYNQTNNRNYNSAHKTNYGNQYIPQSEQPVTVGTWIGLALLNLIPFFGSIIALIIALSSPNQSLKNFGKAMLILLGIGFVLAIIAVILIAVLTSFGASYFYY